MEKNAAFFKTVMLILLVFSVLGCENAIRPFVMGRKAWLFCQSPDGAESSCGMYSLIQTAKLNKINTFEYLKTVFEKTPTATSREDWEKLLPWNIFKS